MTPKPGTLFESHGGWFMWHTSDMVSNSGRFPHRRWVRVVSWMNARRPPSPENTGTLEELPGLSQLVVQKVWENR
jgi:hypothetical protein